MFRTNTGFFHFHSINQIKTLTVESVVKFRFDMRYVRMLSNVPEFEVCHTPLAMNTDLPIVVELVEVEIDANDNPLWSVEYKELYQGRVNCDEYENEGPYLTLCSALMNAFNDNNFAFIILGYIITLINTVDCICLIAMQETINSTFDIVEY